MTHQNNLEKAKEILNRACVAGTSQRYPDLLSDLAATLTTLEKETIERCAKVAEDQYCGHTSEEVMIDRDEHGKRIAQAIRNLGRENENIPNEA